MKKRRRYQQQSRTDENLKNLIIGFFAGLASLMPGISGGTILVITQKYDRLVKAANNVMRLRFNKSDINFFVWVMAGAFAAVFSLSRLMAYVLKLYSQTMNILFVGLILGGAWILTHETELKRPVNIFYAAASFLFTAPVFQYLSENVSNQATGFSVWYLMLGGVFAAFCWVLPGISGSATLVMLGLYEPLMVAVSVWDFNFLIPLGLGAALGGIVCVKLLVALFDRYRDQGMAILLGLTLGGIWGLLGFAVNVNSIVLLLIGLTTSLIIEKLLGA
jgi:putative membrane protein